MMWRIALVLLVVIAAVAPWLGDPLAIAGDPFQLPGSAHPMGTDHMGRDTLVRWCHAARVTLGVGLAVSAIATALGVGLGLWAGWWGGVVDRVVVGVMDALTTLPSLVLQLCIIGVVRPGDDTAVWWLTATLAATGWIRTARVVRAQALALREGLLIEAGRGLGLSTATLIADHVLPRIGPIAASLATLEVISAMLAESALSWMGLGVPPPWPSWGTMVADALAWSRRGWPPLVWPCLGLIWATAAVRRSFTPDGR